MSKVATRSFIKLLTKNKQNISTRETKGRSDNLTSVCESLNKRIFDRELIERELNFTIHSHHYYPDMQNLIYWLKRTLKSEGTINQ